MSYKLRFVQVFKQANADEYMALEKQFAELESRYPEFPKGRRFVPIAGRDASNTLIWECDFPSLEEVYKAQAFFLTDKRHDDLFRKQAGFITCTYTEIYMSVCT